ncbi:MAG: hydrogenase maturation protease [Chloroflexota bacterium]
MSTGAVSPSRDGRHRVVLVACGRPERGDDYVGARAVERLTPETREMVDVRIVTALGPESLVELPADVAVLIVDAVVGVEPGQIVDVDLANLATLSGRASTTSTHQLPLDQVVGLAGLLRERPLEGRFLGVGIEDVSLGAGLSPTVLAVLPEMGRMIGSALSDLVAGNWRREGPPRIPGPRSLSASSTESGPTDPEDGASPVMKDVAPSISRASAR